MALDARQRLKPQFTQYTMTLISFNTSIKHVRVNKPVNTYVLDVLTDVFPRCEHSPVDDVENLDELVVLEEAEVSAEHVDLDLLLYVAPDAGQAMLQLLMDVATVEALLNVATPSLI